MPWVNLDDAFPDHPKNDRLSDAAFRLHIAAICYCNRHLTNGDVPFGVVPRLVPRYKRTALEELACGDKPQWLPHQDGYTIHDYLEWNRSREQVEAERERKSKGGRKGAENRWHKP